MGRFKRVVVIDIDDVPESEIEELAAMLRSHGWSYEAVTRWKAD